MHVNASRFPAQATQVQPSLDRVAARKPASRTEIEAVAQDRRQDQANAAAALGSTAMNFDVSAGGNAIVVTLSDQASGEVLRKLVYDRGGSPRGRASASRGHFIDVAT